MKKASKSESNSIYTLCVYDDGMTPRIFASQDRAKCVEKAMEILEAQNDPDSEYGWDAEDLDKIRKSLDEHGWYCDDPVEYLIRKNELL